MVDKQFSDYWQSISYSLKRTCTLAKEKGMCGLSWSMAVQTFAILLVPHALTA